MPIRRYGLSLGLALACCAALTAGEVKTVDTGYKTLKQKDKPDIACRRVTLNTGKQAFVFDLRRRSIGMRRPTYANFYGGQFFRVFVGKVAYFSDNKYPLAEEVGKLPKREVKKEANGAVAIVATEEGKNAKVTARIEARPGEEFVRLSVTCTPVGPPEPARLDLLTYPSSFNRKAGHKVITYSSGRVVSNKKGDKDRKDSTIQPGETWFFAGDHVQEFGAKGGSGGCAVVWSPEQVKSAKMNPGWYCVMPSFGLKPDVPAEFLLYDFGKMPNAEGLKRMKELYPAKP